MQPKLQQLINIQQPQQIAIDLVQLDQSINQINNLNTDHIQKLSQIPKNKLSSIRSSVSQQQIIQIQKQLTLDILIQRLLQTLIKTKIQLIQLDQPDLIIQTSKTKSIKQSFFQQLKKYNKILLLRQSQLGSLVYIIQNRYNKNFKQKYIQTYRQLQNFVINSNQALKQINTVILQQTFDLQIQFLKQYSDMITLLKLNLVHKKYINDLQSFIRISNRLKIINSKIATIAQFFPYACILDKNDLFSQKKTSQRWQKLLENSIRYKIYGDKQTVNNSFINLKNGINFVNATMSIMHKTRTSWRDATTTKNLTNLAQSTGKILKCLIFKSDAHHQAQVLISDPNKDLAKQIWNLPEQKMFKKLISSVLPSIAFSYQFYIPRVFQQFISKKGQMDVPDVFISNLPQYIKNMNQKNDSKIQMRINSPFILNQKVNRKQQIQPNFKNILGTLVKTFIQPKSSSLSTPIIFHIHGGGFISMSSFIHQTYTRTWANNLKVPIISVDYRKAPQYPFPDGLYDCFEAYMWTLYCYRQIYQSQPVKIILVGDSAGGNLVASLTNLLFALKLRIPDGLVLAYPALNLTYKTYTPSLLTALNDMILPHTFLKICLKAYLKDQIDPSDPYVSPLFASEQILKNYPPVRLFVGSKDPFHDDCCRFTQKLNKINQDKAKLVVFDQFPHGFLQFDVKTQPHEYSRKATKQVENAIGELLHLNK